MLIYHFEHSPFCIAIIHAARAGGIEPELVSIPNGDRSELIRATNGASYQVPVLADNGRVICESGGDSQDIAAYLDANYLNGRLFPKPVQGLQEIVLRYIENDVEAVTFKIGDAVHIPAIPDVVERTLVTRHKERKFGAGCLEQWLRDRPALIAEAVRLLGPFEKMLVDGGSGFLLGPAPVYADFLLYGILGNLTYRESVAFPEELPALHAWYQRMREFRY